MAKFTKGKWEVSQYGYEKFSINGIDGVEICGAWNKFNANLIAAAPEMYELLNEARDFIASNPTIGPCGLGLVCVIDDLLAKARGEL